MRTLCVCVCVCCSKESQTWLKGNLHLNYQRSKEANIHLLAEDQTGITRRSESSVLKQKLSNPRKTMFLLMRNMEEITDYSLERVKVLETIYA